MQQEQVFHLQIFWQQDFNDLWPVKLLQQRPRSAARVVKCKCCTPASASSCLMLLEAEAARPAPVQLNLHSRKVKAQLRRPLAYRWALGMASKLDTLNTTALLWATVQFALPRADTFICDAMTCAAIHGSEWRTMSCYCFSLLAESSNPQSQFCPY